MGLAQYQQIAGLGDVLRGGTPMHPTAMGIADYPRQLPDERHQRVTRAREPLLDACAVEELQARRPRDRLGCCTGDDVELGLRFGERHLDVEPSLPARFQGV